VSPVSWQHHLYWFVPALVLLVDAAATPGRYRVWYAVLAGGIWLTATLSVIEFFDMRVLSRDLLDTVPGFLISNWYLLLMLLLVPVLPIRTNRAAAATRTTAGCPVRARCSSGRCRVGAASSPVPAWARVRS